jgi:hypothetical protein
MSDYLSYAELKAQIIKDATTPGEHRTFEDIISDTVCGLSDSDLALMAGEVPKVTRMESGRDDATASLIDMLESNFRDLLEEEVGEELEKCSKDLTPSASPASPTASTKPPASEASKDA